jgi:hypothetical protein
MKPSMPSLAAARAALALVEGVALALVAGAAPAPLT